MSETPNSMEWTDDDLIHYVRDTWTEKEADIILSSVYVTRRGEIYKLIREIPENRKNML